MGFDLEDEFDAGDIPADAADSKMHSNNTALPVSMTFVVHVHQFL